MEIADRSSIRVHFRALAVPGFLLLILVPYLSGRENQVALQNVIKEIGRTENGSKIRIAVESGISIYALQKQPGAFQKRPQVRNDE